MQSYVSSVRLRREIEVSTKELKYQDSLKKEKEAPKQFG